MKWAEGRTTIFGYRSAAGKRRDAARAELPASPYSDELPKDAYITRSNSDSNSAEVEPVKEIQ